MHRSPLRRFASCFSSETVGFLYFLVQLRLCKSKGRWKTFTHSMTASVIRKCLLILYLCCQIFKNKINPVLCLQISGGQFLSRCKCRNCIKRVTRWLMDDWDVPSIFWHDVFTSAEGHKAEVQLPPLLGGRGLFGPIEFWLCLGFARLLLVA